MQTIICFGAMLSTGLALSFFQSNDQSPVNEYDQPHEHTLSDNKVFVGMWSEHNSGPEDRKFKMYWGAADSPDFECEDDSSWTRANDWDEDVDFACGGNKALRGIKSEHSNTKEDRKFWFKCCDISSDGKYYIHSTQMSGWLNEFDLTVDYKCNENEVMTGMQSYHWNSKEDRQFAIRCGLVQDVAHPIPVTTNRVLTNYLNNYHETFEWETDAGRWISGMRSVHSSGDNEDRKFKFYHDKEPTGLSCEERLGWTGPGYYNEIDLPFEFICPENSVLVGMRSEFVGWAKDRYFGFRCCKVSNGFVVSAIKHMGYQNHYDGEQIEGCAHNEAVVGLKSKHSNTHEDRKFEIICGRVSLDYDDCESITVTSYNVLEDQIEVEDDAAEYNVNEYEAEFKRCGNPNSGDVSLGFETQKSVAISETFSLSESLDKTFSFSQTLETTFTIGSEVSSGAQIGVLNLGGSVSSSFALRTEFMGGQEFSMSSSSTEETQTETEDLQVFSMESSYEAKAFQWSKITATYIEHKVTVPVQMEAKCKRSDGTFKTESISTKIIAGVRESIIVESMDKTPYCEQSYYHNCECVPMSSDYIAGDMGCTEHPNHPGQDGCYTYRGQPPANNCGDGMSLNTAEPPSNSCVSATDFDACPGSQTYLDFPLDSYKFEWSYKACEDGNFPEALLSENGYCPVNYVAIVDLDECKHYAINLLGLPDANGLAFVFHNNNNSNSRPRGCYWNDDEDPNLVFNTGFFDSDASDGQRYSVCKKSFGRRRVEYQVDELIAPVH